MTNDDGARLRNRRRRLAVHMLAGLLLGDRYAPTAAPVMAATDEGTPTGWLG